MKYLEKHMKPGKDLKAAKADLRQRFSDFDANEDREQEGLLRQAEGLTKADPTKTFNQSVPLSVREAMNPDTLKAARSNFDDSQVDRTKTAQWLGMPDDSARKISWTMYNTKYRQFIPQSRISESDKKWEATHEAVPKAAKQTSGSEISTIVNRHLQATSVVGQNSELDAAQEEAVTSDVFLRSLQVVRDLEAEGKRATPEQLEAIVARESIDKPLFEDRNFLMKLVGADAERVGVLGLSAAEMREVDFYFSVDKEGTVIETSKLGFVPKNLTGAQRQHRAAVRAAVRDRMDGKSLRNLPVDEELVDMIWSAMHNNRDDVAGKLFLSVGAQ
jgi:hypothetical protein